LQDLFTKIGFSLTFDTAIIGFLVIAAFFYGISIGRKKVTLLAVSTYIAYALFSTTPYLDTFNLDGTKQAFLHIGVFTMYVLFSYLLLSKTKISSFFHFAKIQGIRHWWQIFILSTLQVGLWVSIVLTLFPEKINLKIAPITELLFTKDNALFFWFLAPILFLGLVRSKKERKIFEE